MKGYDIRDCFKSVWTIAIAIIITIIALSITYSVTEANNRPAWIQAVGSISAIILASLIAIYQSERNLIQARQLRADEKKENINKLCQIIELSYFHYNMILKKIKTTNIQDVDYDTFTTDIRNDWFSYKQVMSYLNGVDWSPYTYDEALTNIFTYIGMHKSHILNTEFESRFKASSLPRNFNPDFVKPDDATIFFVCRALHDNNNVKNHFISYAENISIQYQKIISLLKDIKVNS